MVRVKDSGEYEVTCSSSSTAMMMTSSYTLLWRNPRWNYLASRISGYVSWDSLGCPWVPQGHAGPGAWWLPPGSWDFPGCPVSEIQGTTETCWTWELMVASCPEGPYAPSFAICKLAYWLSVSTDIRKFHCVLEKEWCVLCGTCSCDVMKFPLNAIECHCSSGIATVYMTVWLNDIYVHSFNTSTVVWVCVIGGEGSW